MLKGIKTLIASVFAVALLASPARALTLSSLEKISSDSADIELNTPAEGYDFDATFLANNLELSYKATVENDVMKNCKLYVFLLGPSGKIINYTEKTEIAFSEKGDYQLIFYAVDGEYNISEKVYAFKVV